MSVAFTDSAKTTIAYSDTVSAELITSAIEEFASRYSDKVSVTLVDSDMKIAMLLETTGCTAPGKTDA